MQACILMKDPVKKFKELQIQTESIFDNLFKRTKTPPSVHHSDAIKVHREKFQIRYKIVGSPLRKEYNALDLINSFKNGEITEDTELIQVGVKKPKPIKFQEFMRYEPYRSALSNNGSTIPTDYNTKVYFTVIHFPPDPTKENKKHTATIKELAIILKDNPSLEKYFKVFEDGKYMPVTSSSIYTDLVELMKVV